MGKLIGVYHHDGNIEHLIDYVLGNNGVPEKLMLELPSCWRELRGGHLARVNYYFYRIAEVFEDRGSEIIPGDICLDLIFPRSLWEKLDEAYSQVDPSFAERFRTSLLIMKARFTSQLNLLNPIKSGQRNKGFLKVVEEFHPDLSIVGDDHARYLKAHSPDLDYTRFRSNTLSEQFVHYTDASLLFERFPPKKVIVNLNSHNQKI